MTPRTFAPARLVAVLLALCLSHTAAHAEMDSVVREALALAESGQARKAYDMLEPLEVQRAGDPDFDTVFGIAANQSGEHVRAILALERATQVQPSNTRARAELGRAMFAAGDSRSARTLLEQAKAQGAPAEAAFTIDQFLRAIEVAEALAQSSWRGYVEAGVGHDSNISSGPPNANIAVPLFGGTFTLNANNVKQGATYANLAAGVSGRYVIDSRWSVIGNAGYNHRLNANKSTFNNNQFNIGAGGAYRLDRHEFSVVAVHEDYTVDGSISRSQDGLVGEWVHRIDSARETGAYLQHSKLRYPSQTIRNATRTVAGASFAQQFGQGWLAWGGAYLGKENETTAGQPQFGHSLGGLRVGAQKSFSPSLAAFAALTLESRSYGGPDPFFLVKRSDDQSSLSLGVTWLPAKSWRVTPQLSYLHNRSNIVINDYSRTMASVAARYEF
jgi:tetratricopeptide (TPR) repeat protein